jgi:hypothetical protein
VIAQQELCDLLEEEFGSPCLLAPYGSRRYPRGAIRVWLVRSKEEGDAGKTVVCLVPARTDTRWWWESCRFGEIIFIRGRVRFDGEKGGAPFPSAVVIFGPQAQTDRCSTWNTRTGERRVMPMSWST